MRELSNKTFLKFTWSNFIACMVAVGTAVSIWVINRETVKRLQSDMVEVKEAVADIPAIKTDVKWLTDAIKRDRAAGRVELIPLPVQFGTNFQQVKVP